MPHQRLTPTAYLRDNTLVLKHQEVRMAIGIGPADFQEKVRRAAARSPALRSYMPGIPKKIPADRSLEDPRYYDIAWMEEALDMVFFRTAPGSSGGKARLKAVFAAAKADPALVQPWPERDAPQEASAASPDKPEEMVEGRTIPPAAEDTPADQPPKPGNWLAYHSITIRDRAEMLNLTDMWRAAGSDTSKRPADWRRKEGQAFIDFFEGTMPPGHSSLFETIEGVNGGTWAHWQIALAYAKYLSPEFHVWCNERVRDHMEGKPSQRVVVPENGTLAMMTRMMESQDRMAGIMERMVARLESPVQTTSQITPPQLMTDLQIWDAKNYGWENIRDMCGTLGFPDKEFRYVWLQGLIKYNEIDRRWQCTDEGRVSKRLIDRPTTLPSGRPSHYAVLTRGGHRYYSKEIQRILRFKRSDEDLRQADLYPDHPDESHSHDA